MPESNSKMTSPCDKCPFSLACPPGATGGGDPRAFVGQAYGPFFLPCHRTQDLEGKGNWDLEEAQQCAGAAIFRANVGVTGTLPESLLRLPADAETVFAGPLQLLQHHLGDDKLAEATLWLTNPFVLRDMELAKQEVRGLSATRPAETFPLDRVFLCQQCGSRYTFKDAVTSMFRAGRRNALGAAYHPAVFCSPGHEDRYLQRHQRYPAIGAEIPLPESEDGVCNLEG